MDERDGLEIDGTSYSVRRRFDLYTTFPFTLEPIKAEIELCRRIGT